MSEHIPIPEYIDRQLQYIRYYEDIQAGESNLWLFCELFDRDDRTYIISR